MPEWRLLKTCLGCHAERHSAIAEIDLEPYQDRWDTVERNLK